MKVILATLDAKYIHASLALRYLQAYCSPLGMRFVVKDYTINNGILNILSDIFSHHPDVICFACYIWNIEMTLSLAKLVKKVCPDTKIVLGGPEVSYEYRQLMQENSFIDYIVLGEGEEVLYNLLSCLKEGKDIHVQGLVVREKGEIISLGGPQIVACLDTIPFPYSDNEILELKDKIIYYESSRGCPFSCQYCLSSATNGVRYFDVERVKRDLSFFIKYNVKQVKFVDRTFNANKKHYIPILQFLAAQNCDTNFHFEITVDLLDDEVLSILREVPVGRFQFEIGIQSTYDKTLTQVGRKNNWPKIVRNVQAIQSYGNIHMHLDLIIGLPDEDWEHFTQSFNDVYALKPDMLQIGFLKLLKGSAMRQKAGALEYLYMEEAPYEVLASNVLSYAQIRKLQIFEEVFNLYYNSGKFKYTLNWLIQSLALDAFTMYSKLTDFWEKRGFHTIAHTAKALYGYLAEFCRENNEEQTFICEEFLKFDYLIHKGGIKPNLHWNEQEYAAEKTAFWRNEAVVRKYIADFKFNTWRDLNSKYHIEVFNINITDSIASRKSLHNELTPVLFIRNKEQTTYQKIAVSDFTI